VKDMKERGGEAGRHREEMEKKELEMRKKMRRQEEEMEKREMEKERR